jgi:hypothetical protein
MVILDRIYKINWIYLWGSPFPDERDNNKINPEYPVDPV